MFEIGRELRRFFAPERPREGLAKGDASLLELLDLKLLTSECRAADVAAGRIGVSDRAQRLVEASVVWLELARRSGDAAALRKAAACAEHAAKLQRQDSPRAGAGPALCQQAQAALLGADLFGEDSLNAAAGFLVGQAPHSPSAKALNARLAARRVIAAGDLDAVRAAGQGFDAPLADQDARVRSAVAAAGSAAQLRCDRAEFLLACGGRLQETQLLDWALSDLAVAGAIVDGAYQPLTVARIGELRGNCLVRLGELGGDVAIILDGLDALTGAIDLITPDHSPMDWARLNHAHGLAIAALGEAGDSELAYERALYSFGKALAVLNATPNVALRTTAVQDRAACLVRRAEIKGDRFALDEAEAALRGELASMKPGPDPVAWAVLQLNLARVYMAQAEARGRDHGEAERAGEALLAALDVFAERGLHSLQVAADEGLQRLRTAAARA